MVVTFNFWNKDGSEYMLVKDIDFIPIVGDDILYKERWYTVSKRAFDFDTGRYTKIHCNQTTDN